MTPETAARRFDLLNKRLKRIHRLCNKPRDVNDLFAIFNGSPCKETIRTDCRKLATLGLLKAYTTPDFKNVFESCAPWVDIESPDVIRALTPVAPFVPRPEFKPLPYARTFRMDDKAGLERHKRNAPMRKPSPSAKNYVSGAILTDYI